MEKLQEYRRVNEVVCTEAHTEAAFGQHAAGILDDYYNEGILKNNLGHPPLISDFSIVCSIEESKVLGLGYYFAYFLCIY